MNGKKFEQKVESWKSTEQREKCNFLHSFYLTAHAGLTVKGQIKPYPLELGSPRPFLTSCSLLTVRP